MKTKKSFLNMCVCGLVTAAALTLNGCASSMTEKALASSAFGPLTLTTDQYAEAYMDASDNQLVYYMKLLYLTFQSSSIQQ